MIYEIECPQCHRVFHTQRSNAAYCNQKCRKAAEREREKLKASMFYVAPTGGESTVLHTVSLPTIEEVRALADLLVTYVTVTQVEKTIYIYGAMPEGWTDRPEVLIGEKWKSHPRYWIIATWGLIKEQPKLALPLVAKGRMVGDKELAEMRVAGEEEQAKQQMLAEL